MMKAKDLETDSVKTKRALKMILGKVLRTNKINKQKCNNIRQSSLLVKYQGVK